MKVMVIIKASKASEAGEMPSEQLLREMGNFNEELAKAGVLVEGEGLHPTSNGKRVKFSGKKRDVIDGPFTETKELIAGYWIWNVKSMQEAVEWLKRCPNPHEEECTVEIRQVFTAEDFGEAFTPELREQEERTRQLAGTVKPIPSQFHTVTPQLTIKDCAAALEFYKKAFGAEELTRMPMPDGRLMHASMKIGDSIIMLNDEFPEHCPDGASPKTLGKAHAAIHLYVTDVDAAFKRAVDAGATAQMPPQEMFWGDRYCRLVDPFGQPWSIATHVVDLTHDQIRERMMTGCAPAQEAAKV